MGEVTKELGDYIPKDMQNRICEEAAEEEYAPVYRVAKEGIINERALISTYEEIIAGSIPDNVQRYKRDDIGTYGTSVYSDSEPCKKFVNMMKRHYPNPIIIQGKVSNGLAQRTCERNSDYKDSYHIDWWIYLGMREAAIKFFDKLEDEAIG